MTGYEAFCLYTSLKLHFNSDSYDYFKYNGKVNTSIDAFENRKDKYHFYKLSRRFANADQGRDFIVANLVYDSNVWIGHLLTEESDLEYRKRQKYVQSLTYTFNGEIDILFHDEPKGANEYFIVHDGEYPKLLTRHLQGDISLETMCILNKILNFLPRWDKQITDTIHYPTVSRTMKKYSPFMKYDVTKYKLLLRNAYDHYENTENIS
jgi:hypothetical protein